MKSIVIIMIFILMFSCSKSQIPTEPYSDGSFAIYFLKDPSITMNHLISMDLSELQLESTPWLSDKDISFYDWSSHCIYLKNDKRHFFPDWENNKFNEFPPEWADKPFVVTANREKYYIGYFSNVLSHYWIAPEISDGLNNGYPPDVLFIDWTWLYQDYQQNHPDVKQALMETGLYHSGISVTFDTTDAIVNIENADTSTITYKFTITNNDKDDLYIMDPDKSGSDLFHWFTNGPVFKNLETGKIYESGWKTTGYLPATDYWSPDWFIKLKSGQSTIRAVILKGYPYFPTGEYIFEFRYNGQSRGMEKEVRERTDGRYWLGPTRSNILVMVWKADNDFSNKKNDNRQYLKKKTPQRIYSVNSLPINEYLPVSSTQ